MNIPFPPAEALNSAKANSAASDKGAAAFYSPVLSVIDEPQNARAGRGSSPLDRVPPTHAGGLFQQAGHKTPANHSQDREVWCAEQARLHLIGDRKGRKAAFKRQCAAVMAMLAVEVSQ